MPQQSPAPPCTIPPGPIRLSIDEYLELPNDGKRYQILDGELDVTPAPTTGHQRVSKRLEALLLGLETAGLGEVFDAPIDVVLDRHNIVQPDLIFIRAERSAIITPANIQGAPDLVVEILSPSTRRTDVLTKSALYARFGVASYWVVDPEIDRMEMFCLVAGGYRLSLAGSKPEVLRPEEFPGLEISLAALFR